MVDLENKASHKRHHFKAWERQYVCFPLLEGELLSNPLVMESNIGTIKTQKAYIDTGATTKIMFEKCFNPLSDDERSKLQQSESSIEGIADIPIKPLGQITHNVCSTREQRDEPNNSLLR